MNYIRTKESGFTLIEAMVAFLIITIGLAGAALFQSELIAESGASKARAVAIKLAEKELEEQRSLLTQNDYDGLETFVAAATPQVSSVAVGNATYDISFSAVSAAASTAIGVSEDYYQLSVAVNWDDAKGNSDTVTLSTILSQNLPDNSLDDSDQAGSGSDDTDFISRPRGSAEAIARVTEEQARTSTAVGGFVTVSSGARTYGIKTEETTCASGAGNCENIVSVIKLTGADNQVFTIKGDIFFYGDPDNDFTTIEAAPNVLTSEGGGCAVYEYNSQASYTCLFGEGWYGTISLVLPLENSGRPADSVCLSPRSYKYYQLDPAAVASVGSITTDTVIGQSGLLRFTDSTGNGPYLTASAAYAQPAPGFGYYYLYDKVDVATTGDVTDAANTSGSIEDQHFVVTDDVGNDWADTFTNCIDSGGRREDDPLVLSTKPAGYPALTQANYTFALPSSAATVTIPDDDIIIGYVNTAYEIVGNVIVSGATGTASELKADLEVGIDPLPQYAQACEVKVVDDNSLQYTCYVDYGWGGSVSIDTVSGSAITVNFAPTEYDFSADPVTADVADKNFTVTDP